MSKIKANQNHGKSAHLLMGLLFVGLSLAATPHSAAQCPDGPEGIAAYWSLEESSGLPYEDRVIGSEALRGSCDGGIIGCPGLDENGVVGNAQDFDGNNDGIFVEANPVFDWAAGESFTVETWVKRSSSGIAAEEVLVARRDETSGMQWRLSIENLGAGVHVRASLTDNGAVTDLNLTGTKELANNQWHHLALVYDADANTIAILVDGLVDASSAGISFDGGFASQSAKLTMGYIDDSSDPKRFDGVLDEVAVFGAAVTDRDLASHYYLSRNYCEMYAEDIRVIPLGDSITLGINIAATGDFNGYRETLWNSLFSDLVWVDFQGRLYSGDGDDGPRWDQSLRQYNPNPPDTYPSNPSFDIDHEGHPGIRADQMADSTFMQDIFTANPAPDVVLLHIGTNMEPGVTTAEGILASVESILTQISNSNANATVVVAKIISTQNGTDFRDPIIDAYNLLLEAEVSRRIDEEGEKLILADMTSLLLSGDYDDFLHPNASGYAKMAAEWRSHLNIFMPQFEKPVFVTTSLPEATRGVPYSTAVKTSSRPAPDFNLDSGPSGMVIDQEGQLTWTPPASAPAQVNLQITAIVPGGNVDWSLADRTTSRSFTITLNNRPLAVNKTYGPVASLIDYSVAAGQGLLVGASDPDGDPLTAVLVDGPGDGTVTVAADGSFTYRHTGGGMSDSFTYAVSDGKETSAPALVNLEIQPALSTPEETPITISLTDFVALPAGTTSLAVDTGANYTVNGTTVIPDKDFDAVLTVGIRFLAGSVEVGQFDLGIDVIGVNDAPVIVGQSAINTPVDTAVEVTPADLDIDDPDNQVDDFSLSLGSGANYTVSGTTITPAAGFSGTLTVTVVVSDGDLTSAPFDLTIKVGGGGDDGGGGGGGCFVDSVTRDTSKRAGSPIPAAMALVITLACSVGLRVWR